MSMEQTNAAYGHLNYKLMGRNPTLQHIMRLTLLAPDFLEARARFVGQSIKGFGTEQLRAIATIAVIQYATARIANYLINNDPMWSVDMAFHVKVGENIYGLRSVPADIMELISDPRRFVSGRLSPLLGRGVTEYLTGRNYTGRPVGVGDQLKDVAQTILPMPVKTLIEETVPQVFGSPKDESLGESLLSSMGLRNKKYYSPIQKDILAEYFDANPPKKLDEDEKDRSQFYKDLKKTPEADYSKKLMEGIDKGYIKPNSAGNFIDKEGKPIVSRIDESMFKRLDKSRQEDLLKKMNDEDLRIYLPFANREAVEEVAKTNEKVKVAGETEQTEVLNKYKETWGKISDLKKRKSETSNPLEKQDIDKQIEQTVNDAGVIHPLPQLQDIENEKKELELKIELEKDKDIRDGFTKRYKELESKEKDLKKTDEYKVIEKLRSEKSKLTKSEKKELVR
jgi:hypothetical protein